jgi:carbonic anhydrase
MEIQDIITQIISGNNQFKKEHPRPYFDPLLLTDQKPYITLVSCSDSRVPLNAILPDTVNRIFTIQNIGNQILSTEGSVDYGIYHLSTPVLMIMGHSDCGAIKAYMKGFSSETYNIRHELDFLQPIIKNHESENEFDTLLSVNIEKNIDYQVNIAYKKYHELVETSQLLIIGAYYDFTNDFGKGQGQIIFVNINRHKNPMEMLNNQYFNQISEDKKGFFIGRI